MTSSTCCRFLIAVGVVVLSAAGVTVSATNEAPQQQHSENGVVNADDSVGMATSPVGAGYGTCPCYTTGRNCVSSCYGKPDGDYQSCRCCHGDEAYVSCSGGLIYYRTCPANLVWADDIKRCNYTSRTCAECGPLPPPPPPAPGRCPCTSTGRRCITNCLGLPNGDYQSCECCHGRRAFITCSNGLTYYMPCPSNLVWADNVKQCNYTSSTCYECSRGLPQRYAANEKTLKWTNL